MRGIADFAYAVVAGQRRNVKTDASLPPARQGVTDAYAFTGHLGDAVKLNGKGNGRSEKIAPV
jgi:hypothetical protein